MGPEPAALAPSEVGFGAMADTAQRPTAAAVRSLGELALAAADRHSGDAMRAPGRAADHVRRVRPRDPRDRRRPGLARRRPPATRSAILCGTVPEWPMADFGAFCAGATVVPVYHTNSPEECEYVLSHSGVEGAAARGRRAGGEDRQGPRRAARARARRRAHRRGRGRDHARRPALARRRRRRRDRPRAHRGRRARGHGDDRLHLRHDRPAEGLRALPRQPALHGQRLHRPARAARRRRR